MPRLGTGESIVCVLATNRATDPAYRFGYADRKNQILSVPSLERVILKCVKPRGTYSSGSRHKQGIGIAHRRDSSEAKFQEVQR
jgi:hypothetical protein